MTDRKACSLDEGARFRCAYGRKSRIFQSEGFWRYFLGSCFYSDSSGKLSGTPELSSSWKRMENRREERAEAFGCKSYVVTTEISTFGEQRVAHTHEAHLILYESLQGYLSLFLRFYLGGTAINTNALCRRCTGRQECANDNARDQLTGAIQ